MDDGKKQAKGIEADTCKYYTDDSKCLLLSAARGNPHLVPPILLH